MPGALWSETPASSCIQPDPVSYTHLIRDRSCASVLSGDVLKSEKFREQRISGELYKKLHKASGESGDWLFLLTASMAEGGFYPEKVSENQELYRKYKPEEFQLLLNACLLYTSRCV